MSPRKSIEVETLTVNGDESWSPDDFLMKIAAAVASIPEDIRNGKNSWVVLESGEHWCRLNIGYQREENDEEYATRLANEAKQIAAREAIERRQYEALKKKFG